MAQLVCQDNLRAYIHPQAYILKSHIGRLAEYDEIHAYTNRAIQK